MKILIYLGHPAHFHLYRNPILNWKENGHNCLILIKKKDILEDLLNKAGLPYLNILKEGRSDSKLGIFVGLIKRSIRLFKVCIKFKPDILTGTSVENSFVGKILNVPVINVNEDDASVVPLYAKLSYPWATEILNPIACNSGKWNEKAIKYSSFQELSYLHPNHFIPDKRIVQKYFDADSPYFLLRFAKLNAHHDTGIKGISSEIALKIITILKLHGRVYITSERALEKNLEPYRININPLDIHHVMAFSNLYIGDSQTMAAEAGVLGVPFIRFNDFVGRIGYLEELENVYKLGYGISTNNEEKLFSTIQELLIDTELKKTYMIRKEKMLTQKIDFSKFLTWFIENYPESSKIMKHNPEYQFNFK